MNAMKINANEKSRKPIKTKGDLGPILSNIQPPEMEKMRTPI